MQGERTKENTVLQVFFFKFFCSASSTYFEFSQCKNLNIPASVLMKRGGFGCLFASCWFFKEVLLRRKTKKINSKAISIFWNNLYSSVPILNLPRRYLKIFYQSVYVYIKNTSFACMVSVRTCTIGPVLCEDLYRCHFGKVLKSSIGNICFLCFRCFLLNIFYIVYLLSTEHNRFQIWTLTRI